MPTLGIGAATAECGHRWPSVSTSAHNDGASAKQAQSRSHRGSGRDHLAGLIVVGMMPDSGQLFALN